VGGLIGGIITGYASEKLGKRVTMGIACIISIGSAFMQVFAKQPELLLVGKVRNVFFLRQTC
jgi:MFS transporter, SP family, general alpha glucoside:H+ symporter